MEKFARILKNAWDGEDSLTDAQKLSYMLTPHQSENDEDTLYVSHFTIGKQERNTISLDPFKF